MFFTSFGKSTSKYYLEEFQENLKYFKFISFQQNHVKIYLKPMFRLVLQRRTLRDYTQRLRRHIIHTHLRQTSPWNQLKVHLVFQSVHRHKSLHQKIPGGAWNLSKAFVTERAIKRYVTRFCAPWAYLEAILLYKVMII